MKKALFLYALAVTALLLCTLRHYRSENRRLEQNQTALASDLHHYRTRLGEEAASAQALRLRCAEFERLRDADAARIRALGIRLRRLEAASKHVTRTEVTLRAPLGDPLLQPAAPTQDPLRRTPHEALLPDSLRRFRWSDPWVTVEGILGRDSVACRIESRDTLRQIIHRIPRRFLFIRWSIRNTSGSNGNPSAEALSARRQRPRLQKSGGNHCLFQFVVYLCPIWNG